ncbi:SOUL family heme-binding protein [Haloarcula onubensis]|uniref:Heme-binding protein n=1 Tax=Haloarcula onubensis TaxID=2950539 RepID=A0ABU2FMC0_9EURY|nr:heme-binding protein [Halomicroarcula sp. S3CR25-11]MDS0281907.1 heme-binding protein [Halomicroarcula sp. S3CR25-11]
MAARNRSLLAGLGTALALWVAWGLYVGRTTGRVPFETVDELDGVELRQYPQTVLVETTAPTAREAFGRLFGYLKGANEGDRSVSMTAPVRTDGATVDMTAPVRTAAEGDRVTMAFWLPASYTPESAPVPTDPRVSLVVEPARTAAVRSFGWYATAGRVARERERLLDTLANRGVDALGDPVVLQYDDPWTPPFMRHNEVEVDVDRETIATDAAR